MSDTCARCGGPVTHTAAYSTSTAKVVERVCERDARKLKRAHGRLVKVHKVLIEAP